MYIRAFSVVMALATLLPGASKKVSPTVRGESESVELMATAILDRAVIKEALGSDLDGYYVLVDVRVTSRFGKEIDVRRDDFVLRTDKDGEKSAPFAPSQIAGKGALVIRETSGGGGGIMGDSGGPVWGGVPGTMGRPGRLGGDGGAIGAGGGGTSESQATVRSDVKLNPLEKTLRDKMMPEKKTDQSVTGLLYFPLGKQKLKDLELIYTATDGKISIRFR